MKMKSIEEYINEITNHKDPEYDLLDECILNQLRVYYNFNLITITESMILESKGSFPNQDQMVNKILNEIDSNQDVSIVKIDNNIVDKIYLYFKTEENDKFHCEYVVDNEKYDDYNLVRWDNDNKRYKFAEIDIINYTNKKELEEFLYHETQHLWDDYQSMIHKNIPLSDKVKNSLDTKFKNSNIDKTLKDILYYIDDYEISAYISQMNGLFNGKKFSYIKDAFNDIIYTSYVYQNYKWIYYALYNDKYVDMLSNAGIKKSEITNMKKIIKKKFNKIINHAYHICGEHTEQHLNPGSIQDKHHRLLKDTCNWDCVN